MPKKIIEAALFMSTRPMTTKELSKISGHPPERVEERLEELRKDYEGKGFEVIRSPDGWNMRVAPDLLPKVAHLTPYSELRDGHKRTLALVAYKEPIKQSEVVRIQGNKCYSYIKLLIKKGLIKSEKQGRTKILSLTKEFERYFGEEKERIKEMLQKGMEAEEKKEEKKETPEAEEERVEKELKEGNETPEEKAGEKEKEEDAEKSYSDIDETIPFSKD